MTTNDLSFRVAEWRQKCSLGTITQDEMIEAIAFLRAQRGTIKTAPLVAKATRPTKTQADVGEALAAFLSK